MTRSNCSRGRVAYGAARRTTAYRSSAFQVSEATVETITWASASRALVMGRSGSMSRAAIAEATTAASRKSWAWVGNRSPRLTSPTRCPARPTRCSADAIDGGDCTSTTWSRSPMSMPISSEFVATMAFSSPSFRRRSTSVRISRARDPWWA